MVPVSLSVQQCRLVRSGNGQALPACVRLQGVRTAAKDPRYGCVLLPGVCLQVACANVERAARCAMRRCGNGLSPGHPRRKPYAPPFLAKPYQPRDGDGEQLHPARSAERECDASKETMQVFPVRESAECGPTPRDSAARGYAVRDPTSGGSDRESDSPHRPAEYAETWVDYPMRQGLRELFCPNRPALVPVASWRDCRWDAHSGCSATERR